MALNIKIGWPILSQTNHEDCRCPCDWQSSAGSPFLYRGLLRGFSMLIGSTGSNQDHSNANPDAWWCFQSNIPLFILGTRYIRLKLNDRTKWTHFLCSVYVLNAETLCTETTGASVIAPPSPSYPVTQVCLCYGACTFFLLCLLWASDLCIKAWLRMKQWQWRSHPLWQCFSLSLENKNNRVDEEKMDLAVIRKRKSEHYPFWQVKCVWNHERSNWPTSGWHWFGAKWLAESQNQQNRRTY